MKFSNANRGPGMSGGLEDCSKPKLTKQDDIECYINLYKSVHNHKPRALDLQSWTREELQQGIRVLSAMGEDHE